MKSLTTTAGTIHVRPDSLWLRRVLNIALGVFAAVSPNVAAQELQEKASERKGGMRIEQRSRTGDQNGHVTRHTEVTIPDSEGLHVRRSTKEDFDRMIESAFGREYETSDGANYRVVTPLHALFDYAKSRYDLRLEQILGERQLTPVDNPQLRKELEADLRKFRTRADAIAARKGNAQLIVEDRLAAARICRQLYGNGNLVTKSSYQALAVALHNVGDNTPAVSLLIDLLQFHVNEFTARDLNARAETLGTLVDCSLDLRDDYLALLATDAEMINLRDLVGRNAFCIPESEHIEYIDSVVELRLSRAISLAIRLMQGNDAISSLAVGMSANWVANFKCIAYESLTERGVFLRHSTDSELQREFRDLCAARKQLATIVAATAPGTNSAQSIVQAMSTVERIDERVADHLRKTIDSVALPSGALEYWVDVQKVRRTKGLGDAAFPRDTVLVEFVQFDMYDFQSRKAGRPSIAAWIVPNNDSGPIRCVFLGPAAPITKQILKVKDLLYKSRQRIIAVGSEQAEKELRTQLDALSTRLLRPIMPFFGNAKRVVFSPDESTWLVPWSAMPVRKKAVLLEDYCISTVACGRWLCDRDSYDRTSQVRAWAVGLPSRIVGFGVHAVEPPIAFVDATSAGHPQLTADAKVLPELSLAMETYSSKLLRAGTPTKPRILLGDDAASSALLGIRQPAMLYVGSHATCVDVPPTQNSLLGCVLHLAKGQSERGDVSGLEVLELNLSGTDLVILNACETGSGVVQQREGVANLAKAFQLAGANSVVCSLWPIDDSSSSDIILSFLQNLANGESKEDSLRNAQLLLMNGRPNKSPHRHPYFWAAFQLVSRGN